MTLAVVAMLLIGLSSAAFVRSHDGDLSRLAGMSRLQPGRKRARICPSP